MSYIPDCRTDEDYNYRNLGEKDKQFVNGYDWCAEMAVDNFFDNFLDNLPADSYLAKMLSEELPESMQDSYEMDFDYGDRASETREIKTYYDYIRSEILDWIEAERDELITSMIDNQHNEE